MDHKITAEVARKVLDVVDAGLVKGQGNPVPGGMCVEAAVCYALGLPHGDDPKCVSRALRQLKIKLNDSNWSSNEARAKGLRRLALVQLGSAGHLDDKEFVRRVAELAIRKSVPQALRSAASIQKDHHKAAAMRGAADRCEKEGTREAALEGKNAASYASYASYAAASAASAASAAAASAASAASAADASAASASYAAASAADAAASASEKKAVTRDKSLAAFCEDVVQILIDMKAPGAQWLSLTEIAA